MLKEIGLAAVLAIAMAAPALADDCGVAPIPPAIPAPNDIASKPVEDARKVVLDAYHQVKAYQGSLKPYRACLDLQTNKDKADMDAAKQKKDTVQAASLQDQMDERRKTYDGTVDAESEVAAEFNKLHTAQCTRDTDPMICPKQ